MTERGPLQSFELTWSSGHVETIKAHQVSYPGNSSVFGGPVRQARVDFRGEIDGHWLLILSALEADLVRIRNTTQTEPTLVQESDES